MKEFAPKGSKFFPLRVAPNEKEAKYYHVSAMSVLHVYMYHIQTANGTGYVHSRSLIKGHDYFPVFFLSYS